MNKSVCFVDLEASSADADGWPTELGWAFPFGDVESFLIEPQRSWCDGSPRNPYTKIMGWSDEAKRVTGINLSMLLKHGVKPDQVAKEFLSNGSVHHANS